ncbi:MAG: PKD domain-containing protein [Acidobacteriaceae bacterium]
MANAGGPYSGTAGTAISFSGAGSSDPQGEALTYGWSFGDGTGTGVSPTHTYPVNGYAVSTYNILLTVTNTSGLSATAGTTATISAPQPLADGALTGVVTSGTNSSGTIPVAYVHVYLFAANTTGYGQPSVSLLNATLTGTSDSVGAYVATAFNGTFSLTGDYSCTSGQQLYLYVQGGDAGTGQNASEGLMAAIGSCPSSTGPGTSVTVNEVSTVAAAYAMAGFATDATHVSSSGTALAQVGVANAFANAANLASLSTGTVLAATPSGNGTVPQAEIGTLANVLAHCINVGGTPCSTLMQTATSDGTSTGTIPTDTATAAINIAHNPGANIATLYGLASTAAFAPVLTAVPNDFTVALTFTGGGLNEPFGAAIDGSGNVWFANLGGNSVTKLSSLGTILSGTNGFTGSLSAPDDIAIDGSGNAWVSNSAGNSVTELSSTGSPATGSPYTGGGLSDPKSIAIDGSGDAWITNYNSNSVTELSSSGSAGSGSPHTGGGLLNPLSIAIDGSNNVWIADQTNNSVTELSNTGSLRSGANGFTGGKLNQPEAIAIDGSGEAWIANLLGNSVTELSSTGTVLSGTNGFTGGGLSQPYAIAIDGSGNAWIVNTSNNLDSVSEISSSGAVLTGATGYTGGGSLESSSSIAIDGSGDIWITNLGNSVTELIGAATPVVTPIAAGVKNNKLGARP